MQARNLLAGKERNTSTVEIGTVALSRVSMTDKNVFTICSERPSVAVKQRGNTGMYWST
jgi:hypothetical protein